MNEPVEYEISEIVNMTLDGSERFICTNDPAYLEMKRRAEAPDKLEGMARNGQTVEIVLCPGGRGILLDPSSRNSLIPSVTAPSLVEAIEQIGG